MLNREQDFINILRKYNINPDELIETQNSTIVYTNNQAFTVRKMQVTEAQLATWEAVFHEAYRHHLHAVLPVYKTNDGSTHVQQGSDYYYITPFVQSESSLQISDVLTSIGNIHKKTKREIDVPKDKMIAHFKSYVHTLEEKHLYLQQMIDFFEQQHYMSPFELQVCSQFHIIDRIFKQSREHANAFIRHCEETENDEIKWASSLCHNALTVDSAVKGREVYITNWERASYDNATSDLISFLHESFRTNIYPLEAYVDGMIAYEEEYDFSDIEKDLMSMHLLHAVPYVEAVQSYATSDKKLPVISQVIALERLYRTIAHSFFMFHELEKYKKSSYSTENESD